MVVRPFKLLNESERARIAGSAATAFDAWRREWLGAAIVPAQPACNPAADHESLSLADDWLTFVAGDAAIHVAQGAQASSLMRAAISAGSTEAGAGDNTIAADLVRAAWKDLAQRLIGAAPDRSDAAPPPGLWRRGSGAACVTLPLARGEIAVLYDSALISRLIAPRQRPAARLPALANPQLGIGRQPVEIQVWLGKAEIDLATFQTLAVNDVLLLDSRIDEPLRISVAGVEVAPRAVLGYTDQRKAVRLTTHAFDR